jgi:hypothetical protein
MVPRCIANGFDRSGVPGGVACARSKPDDKGKTKTAKARSI